MAEMNATVEELQAKQKEFDERIKKVWPSTEQGTTVLDGIIDIESYVKSEAKILWILKEAIDPDPEPSDEYTYRECIKDACDKSNWKGTTWGKVARISAGIQKFVIDENVSEFYYEKLPPLEQYEEESSPHFYSSVAKSDIYPLDEIAFINVAKVAVGNKSSNQAYIDAAYSRPEAKELLLDQIKFINPRIIIIGSGTKKLAEDLAGTSLENFREDANKITRYFKKDDQLIIYTHHPNQRDYDNATYFNSIFEAVEVGY